MIDKPKWGTNIQRNSIELKVGLEVEIKTSMITRRRFTTMHVEMKFLVNLDLVK
jgi:hypothetical protein